MANEEGNRAPKDTKRLSLDITRETWERLNRVKNLLDANSNTETITRALRVVEYLEDARRKGQRVALLSNTGRVTEVVVLG